MECVLCCVKDPAKDPFDLKLVIITSRGLLKDYLDLDSWREREFVYLRVPVKNYCEPPKNDTIYSLLKWPQRANYHPITRNKSILNNCITIFKRSSILIMYLIKWNLCYSQSQVGNYFIFLYEYFWDHFGPVFCTNLVHYTLNNII